MTLSGGINIFDIISRGGTGVDGTGATSRIQDVASTDGKIVQVADVVGGEAREVIQANGLLVTPGFIDIHTHYDGQVSWDTLLEPSSAHGVTTVVVGNCGVGFAPVRPVKQEWLVQLMAGVEDIPCTSLPDGINWEGETFPEYPQSIDKPRNAVDVAANVPTRSSRGYGEGE